jgi:CrcB protein
MKSLLLATVGGGIGAGCRFLVGKFFAHHGFIQFPWATLTVNVTGCFLMGVLIEVLALRYNGSNELRILLATGVLGGYTTFSSFSLEFATLYERGEINSAIVYMLASVILSLFAVFFGIWASRTVLG